MQIREFSNPIPHIVIEKFLPEKLNQEIFNELKKLEPFFQSGKMLTSSGKLEADNRKKAEDLWLDEHYKNNRKDSNILTAFENYFWGNQSLIDKLVYDVKIPIYESLLFTKNDATRITRYKNNSYYGFHKDEIKTGHLTLNYMKKFKPDSFEGGDFVMKWRGKEKKIKFKDNRLILFPRIVDHMITTIKTKNDEFINNRFAIQHWPIYPKELFRS